ncbi:MAG: alpha/beta fold hydrolase [Pseudomonadota bacterium]
MTQLSLPPFTGDRWPWRGGDLQTVRNSFLGPPQKPRRQTDTAATAEDAGRYELPMDDGTGDHLVAYLDLPNHANNAEHHGPRPLVVLIHGLTGCSGSAYILSAAAAFQEAGYRVLRLNLRGAGPSRATCTGQYHAGRSEDLHRVLNALPKMIGPGLTEQGVLLVGYSLGANMLLKYLGECGSGVRGKALVPVHAAVSVSAPVDLKETCFRFLEARNALYQRYLLSRMRLESVSGAAVVSSGHRAAIEAARTVLAFDDGFVAPANGYTDAFDYYQQCSAKHFINAIRIPTLILHAQDDPWIPMSAYGGLESDPANDRHVLLTRSGGHVGFHAAGHKRPWSDRAMVRFFDEKREGSEAL